MGVQVILMQNKKEKGTTEMRLQVLNGDLGQMDGGLLSRYILEALERNGYDEEGTSE